MDYLERLVSLTFGFGGMVVGLCRSEWATRFLWAAGWCVALLSGRQFLLWLGRGDEG